MKRSAFVTILFLFAASLAHSQTSAPPAPPDDSRMHAQHREHPDNMCKQMMAEHVAAMKNTSQTLASNLAQMKSTLPMIKDLNERSRWQSNIAMWQALADHFDQMAKHAQHMQEMGMGCGMMMGRGTGEHKDHEHPQPATPAKPQ